MSSFLDPRMNGGLGMCRAEKEYIWDEIKTRLFALALHNSAVVHE